MSDQDLEGQLDAFREETGIWPPGRSMPAAYCGEEDVVSVRGRAFRFWRKSVRQHEADKAEIERLKAALTADSPWVFADGTSAHSGDLAWFPGEEHPGNVDVSGWFVSSDAGEWGAETLECYPTQEAAQAEAAKETKP